MRKSIIALSVLAVAGMTFGSCSVEPVSNTPATPSEGPAIKVLTKADGSEASYAHKAVLVSGDNIADVLSASTAAGLGSFTVEAGDYTVYAVASSDESNLTFSGLTAASALTSARITVSDMGAQIPEIMVGASAPVTVGAADATASVELVRAVAYINVTVSGLEASQASSISLTIGNMYDQIDLSGAAMLSGSDFASKTIVLNRTSEGKYTGNAIVLPTDASASTLTLTYSVDGSTYRSTPAGRIEANTRYNLNTSVTGLEASTVALKSEITYAEWNSSLVTLEDSFDVTATTEKTWAGPTALPIGGDNDNFWASSSLVNDWAKNYDSYLYDGITDNGDYYWCPAENDTPVWYIDLKSAVNGISLDYWNKAGGKGGQKIKTFDIYVSDLKSDYQTSTSSNWVKISTFTSDKTTPTTDAGAKVSTGLIKFSEDGSAAYQYVKCVVTAKVSSNGDETTETLDVNVGEVNVFTWKYE